MATIPKQPFIFHTQPHKSNSSNNNFSDEFKYQTKVKTTSFILKQSSQTQTRLKTAVGKLQNTMEAHHEVTSKHHITTLFTILDLSNQFLHQNKLFHPIIHDKNDHLDPNFVQNDRSFTKIQPSKDRKTHVSHQKPHSPLQFVPHNPNLMIPTRATHPLGLNRHTCQILLPTDK